MKINDLELFEIPCECGGTVYSTDLRCPKCGKGYLKEITAENKKMTEFKLSRERAIRLVVVLIPLILIGWWISTNFSLEGFTCLVILGLFLFHIINIILFGIPWKILKWIIWGR